MTQKKTTGRDQTKMPRGPEYGTPVDPRKQFKVHPDIKGGIVPMPRTTGGTDVPHPETERQPND